VFERLFVEGARNIVPQYRQFEAEARKDGARFIEAEHVLLALAASDTEAGRLLVEAGLDHAVLIGAFQDERRRTLAFASVEPLTGKLVETDRPVTLGTSAKTALRRAIHASHREHSRRSRVATTDLLVGILQAELGTVPRALAIAGIDRAALIARVRAGAGMNEQRC
jgi:ATP-dependent Clp protease ATP-binding subunit ClpA